MIDKAAWRSIRTASRGVVATELDLRVDGLDIVPPEGPVLLAARHYHHLYDGCAVMATIPRQVQVLVGLDWIERPMALKAMQAACRSAGWPVVYRNTDAIATGTWLPALRKALDESRSILEAGRVLLVFPEGYPTIDPHGSPKTGEDEILPFNPGVARIAIDAWRSGIPVTLLPVGFHYVQRDRWQVNLRFGDPVDSAKPWTSASLTDLLQDQVTQLSSP